MNHFLFSLVIHSSVIICHAIKLRSFSQTLLQVPVSRLKSYGDCAFSVAAPTLWNGLPEEIRNVSPLEKLKPNRKTHLSRINNN